jgi:hypothetical protein
MKSVKNEAEEDTWMEGGVGWMDVINANAKP